MELSSEAKAVIKTEVATAVIREVDKAMERQDGRETARFNGLMAFATLIVLAASTCITVLATFSNSSIAELSARHDGLLKGKIEGITEEWIESKIREEGEYKKLENKILRSLDRLAKATVEGRLPMLSPGMIVPFVGNKDQLVKLVSQGWVICDGDEILDEKAVEWLRKKPTPNLEGRYLKGVSRARSTYDPKESEGGDGTTGSIAGWSTLPYIGAGSDDDEGVLPKNNRHHQHKFDPPNLEVVFLMYVRDFVEIPVSDN